MTTIHDRWETAGTAPGEKCYKPACTAKATHFHTSYKRWYCYHCSVQINGAAKKKVCISSKEHMLHVLSTPQDNSSLFTFN